VYERSGTAKVNVGFFGFLSVVALSGLIYGVAATFFGSRCGEIDEDELTLTFGEGGWTLPVGASHEAPGDPPAPEDPEPDDPNWNPAWGDKP
jgi:hypothetical protein